MSILKDFRFTVDVKGNAERVVETTTEEGLALSVATPPEFRGGIHGMWSPEHLLVSAVSSCYALTLAGVADRRQIPLHDVAIRGVGHITRRADARFGFVVVELAVEITTEEGFEDNARRAARAAESGCLIAQALRIPVEIELEVQAAAPTPV
ncbi:MAG: OsmC family protein [Gaiellaceae bacterium]